VRLTEAWPALRDRYAVLLVDRLGLVGHLRDVAIHALTGGKRIRPMLAELLGRALRAPEGAVTDVAIAVEYLHTASLMLDDLPCMDGAKERRGAATAHARFSEADAILTAVALVSRSYSVLLGARVGPDAASAMAHHAIETVARTMAPGQAMELSASSTSSREDVEHIHTEKTASLFGLLARLVAISAGASAEVTDRIVAFATLWGRAYQIADDIEDRDEPGEDRANLARILTIEDARAEAAQRLSEARALVRELDAAGELGELVAWLERLL
jgi:geranylgeranyl diphosphate synthase, type II